MADDFLLCIIEEMDRLWFHQTILRLSEPTVSVAPQPSQTPLPLPESFPCPASILSLPLLSDKVASSSTDESHSLEVQTSSESISVSLQNDSNNEEEKKERPAKINFVGRIRSHSSFPPAQNRPRKSRKAARRLKKSMSCRSMGGLEIVEIKGFMDMGFICKQESINPRLMSVVPGLQRLGITITQTEQNPQAMDEQVEQEEQRDIIRPYLSDGWLIKRPDSPLLNLKIPNLCSSAYMKKHLRFWDRTVASETHLHDYMPCLATYEF